MKHQSNQEFLEQLKILKGTINNARVLKALKKENPKMSRCLLGKIEAGHVLPTPQHLEIIVNVLGCTALDLYKPHQLNFRPFLPQDRPCKCQQTPQNPKTGEKTRRVSIRLPKDFDWFDKDYSKTKDHNSMAKYIRSLMQNDYNQE